MPDTPLPIDARTVVADWFARCHASVIAQLTRESPHLDQDLIHDAFVETLLQIGKEPERFDPRRATIHNFLVGATRLTLRGLVRSDRRRRRREREKQDRSVADGRSAARSPEDGLAERELAQTVRETVAQSDQERQFLTLWEWGIEDRHEYAQALGIADRPEAEQAAIIKRTRDRLTQRIRRLKARWVAEEDGS